MPETRDHLNIEGLPIEVDIKDVDKMSGDDFIRIRRNGFGASDSSILAGVNPYQNKFELIKSKLRTEITAEERAVGQKSAVRKGRELEPLVIQKSSAVLDREVMKPVDMYRFKEIPFLTINFDGVAENLEDKKSRYIPVEIKIVTKPGERHYNKSRAIFRESELIQWQEELPKLEGIEHLNIQQRAAYYGIPPYYYTQCQQEMFGLDAPFSYLATLIESTWELVIYKIWFDKDCMDTIIAEGEHLWKQIEDAKNTDTL